MMVLKTLLIAALLFASLPANAFMLMGARAATTTNYADDPNCQGAWFMNADGATDETDRSGNGNDLTVSTDDTIPRSATVPSGYSGYSRDFEYGDNDYMSRANANLVGLNINGANAKITLAAWVKLESVQASYTHMLISKTGSASTYQYYLGAVTDGSSNISFIGAVSPDGTSPDATESVTTTLNTYTTGTWYHVAFVSNDSQLLIYVNGALACTPVNYSNGIFNSTAAFQLGTYSAAWGMLDGLLDDAIVLDRALSASEIKDLYTNGITGGKGLSD